jgi:hypothetical protein
MIQEVQQYIWMSENGNINQRTDRLYYSVSIIFVGMQYGVLMRDSDKSKPCFHRTLSVSLLARSVDGFVVM